MKRVIMTGATSMIGIALIEECIKNGVEVYALIRPSTLRFDRLPNSPLLHIVSWELGHLDDLIITEKGFDAFYHFAWTNTDKVRRNDPVSQYQNIEITLSAVRLASRIGCKKFVGAGSQAEYGYKDELITPETRADPEIAYGVAKLAAGKLSAILCSQLDLVHIWVRVFSVYGPNDNEGTMVTIAIRTMLGGKRASFSPATHLWDYLYSSDAGKAFFLIGEKAKEDKVYCLASGKSRPLHEYIETIRNQINPDLKVGIGDIPYKGKPQNLSADISNLVRDVGFTPTIEFCNGIKKIVEVYQNSNS